MYHTLLDQGLPKRGRGIDWLRKDRSGHVSVIFYFNINFLSKGGAGPPPGSAYATTPLSLGYMHCSTYLHRKKCNKCLPFFAGQWTNSSTLKKGGGSYKIIYRSWFFPPKNTTGLNFVMQSDSVLYTAKFFSVVYWYRSAVVCQHWFPQVISWFALTDPFDILTQCYLWQNAT